MSRVEDDSKVSCSIAESFEVSVVDGDEESLHVIQSLGSIVIDDRVERVRRLSQDLIVIIQVRNLELACQLLDVEVCLGDLFDLLLGGEGKDKRDVSLDGNIQRYCILLGEYDIVEGVDEVVALLGLHSSN